MVLFGIRSFGVRYFSTFCLSTFGHSAFGHSTFGHSTFCHSTFCLSAFGHSAFSHSAFGHSASRLSALCTVGESRKVRAELQKWRRGLKEGREVMLHTVLSGVEGGGGHRWARLLKQQSSITVYRLSTKETYFRFPFPFATNKRKFVFIFCLQ